MKDFLKRSLSNSLLKNYLKIFSVDALVKGSALILLPVYLTLMSQKEFGLFGYVFAIVSTFSLVFNLGIYTAQSKLFHDYPPEKRGRVLFTINVLLFAFIAFIIFLTLVFDIDYPVVDFLFQTNFDYSRYRFFVLFGVVVSVYSLMVTNYLLTSEKFTAVQTFNIARIILIHVVVLAILFLSPGEDLALLRLKYAYLTEFAILSVFLVMYCRQMEFKFDKTIAQKALRISMPVFMSAFLGIFINLADRYAIEKHGTLEDMSVYNLALSISSIIPFVFASFQNVWLPHFLKEKDRVVNRERSKKMVLRLLVLFLVISLAILIAIKVLLLLNVIDNRYNEVIPLLPIVLASSIVSCISMMYSNHLIYVDMLHVIILAGIPISVLAVFLNLVLVREWNVYGAGLSTLLINGCYLVVYSTVVTFFYNRNQVT